MWPVSAAFMKALGTSPHRIVVKVSVVDPLSGQVLVDAVPLDAPNCNVTIDRRQAIRRRCVLSVNDVDGSLMPTDPSSLLAPYGNELFIQRGLVLADGTTELVPLGMFPIAKATSADTGDRTILIEGYDRGRRVSRARLLDYYPIAPGTNVGDAALALIKFSVPSLSLFRFTPTSLCTPLDAPIVGVPNDDPYALAIMLAGSIGFELFLDPLGGCVFQPVADPVTAVLAMTYASGVGSLLTAVGRVLTTDGTVNRTVANHVVRIGEGSGIAVPIRGEAMDLNPGSPTYIYGKYGPVSDVASSSLLGTQEAADAAALADLRTMLGEAESGTFGSMVNPAHEASDVVRLSRPEIGVTNKFVVMDAMVVPLDAAGVLATDTRLVARTS